MRAGRQKGRQSFVDPLSFTGLYDEPNLVRLFAFRRNAKCGEARPVTDKGTSEVDAERATLSRKRVKETACSRI